MISARRSLQEDFSKHGEVDGDDLFRVVVTLSESCSDLLLVHQTRQDGLQHRTTQNTDHLQYAHTGTAANDDLSLSTNLLIYLSLFSDQQSTTQRLFISFHK